MTFCIGDRVRMLNANAIENEAGRSLTSQCMWWHDNVSEHAGEVGVIREFRESAFKVNGGVRDCFRVVTDDGEEYWCHPEWMEMVEEANQEPIEAASDELCAMFSDL